MEVYPTLPFTFILVISLPRIQVKETDLIHITGREAVKASQAKSFGGQRCPYETWHSGKLNITLRQKHLFLAPQCCLF